MKCAREQVCVQKVWDEGYLGQGITAAVLDTGIWLHPDFDTRIRGFFDCVDGKQAMYDDSGHGTHVSGILLGNGRMSKGIYCGMAPKAELYSVKVLDKDGNGMVENVVKGIRHVLSVYEKESIRIVNISVGTEPGLGKQAEQLLLWEVEALWDAGLIVVVSAGNYGPAQGSIAVPGASRKVITVGAVDVRPVVLTGGGKNWDYSGRGPTGNCVVKPDLVAPGTGITSCAGGKRKGWYLSRTGTSMAAPIVSGGIACLLSKYPDMTNVEVKLKLRESCTNTQRDDQGWGILNMEKLLSCG